MSHFVLQQGVNYFLLLLSNGSMSKTAAGLRPPSCNHGFFLLPVYLCFSLNIFEQAVDPQPLSCKAL